MSRLLFWSPGHGQGQTSNLQVIALTLGLLHKKKVLMMQTCLHNNNLEVPLVGGSIDMEENSSLFQEIGLDTAVTYSRMNKMNARALSSCCLTFPGTSLLLLPGTQAASRDTFDRDVAGEINRLVREAEDYLDFVLIDSGSGDNPLSSQLGESADLIIINLTQRRHVIHQFFRKYGENLLKHAKVFYLFGGYDSNSAYNIHNCRRKYSRYLNRNNSGIIPYCTKLMDAQNEGSMLPFMKKGLITGAAGAKKWTRKGRGLLVSLRYSPEETGYFFQEARSVADKILCMLAPALPEQREDTDEFL